MSAGRRSVVRALVAGVFAVAVAAAAQVYTDDVLDLLDVGRVAPYTELGVADPAQLDDGVQPGEAIVVFIANRTGSDQRYAWRFSIDGRSVKHGVANVTDGTAVDIPVVVPATGTRAEFRLDTPAHVLRWSVQR